ncbi:hypothetical protein CAMGR0001_0574 [Campylobacter gracilis RM3268]|uniref:Uncharacterized protein n=1 Tax=Campylobacter gracilis RM3268 TaxID=553220 RepID=C8PHX8_9BACT|nr:hypothetical protein CAMGR0001_0574 [Campylobacter gracilis RM3268]
MISTIFFLLNFSLHCLARGLLPDSTRKFHLAVLLRLLCRFTFIDAAMKFLLL